MIAGGLAVSCRIFEGVFAPIRMRPLDPFGREPQPLFLLPQCQAMVNFNGNCRFAGATFDGMIPG